MAITVKVQPRKDYVKSDGTSRLYLQVTINRRTLKYPLEFYVLPEKWDSQNQTLKGRGLETEQLNAIITSEKSRAREILADLSRNGQATFEAFEATYLCNHDPQDYYAFFQKHIDHNREKFSSEHIRSLKAELSKIKKFRSTLQFKEIDHKFLCDYEHYMRADLKNSTNTVTKTMKKHKAVINEAMKQNDRLYSRSPFFNFTLHSEPTHRDFLTKEELNALFEAYPTFTGKIANVAQYFLFSCYTGLRFQDIKNLRCRDVQNDRISIIMNKTKDSLIIPLLDKAKQLLPTPGKPDDPVFHVLSNQKTNDYLKLAVEKAGIVKEISFHCARHTFATVALNSNIPLEVVQKLLGHSMIRTTQIYAKIVNKTVFEQMKKLE